MSHDLADEFAELIAICGCREVLPRGLFVLARWRDQTEFCRCDFTIEDSGSFWLGYSHSGSKLGEQILPDSLWAALSKTADMGPVMKILMVEDNPVDRMFVAQSLRQVEGFEYEICESGSLANAFEQMGATHFDVLLLDLWLPDSEGLETCQRVVTKNRDIPVVVMTGTDDHTLATEAIRIGAQDYLVKGSFPGSAIARVLEYAIDRSHFQRDLAQQRNHFHQVLSHVPAIIWTTDRELMITSARGAGLQFLTPSQQQAVGKTLGEYFRGSLELDGVDRVHQRALAGESVSFESEWLGRIFDVKIEPLRERERDVAGTIGIALDVTERRNLDREISFARLVQESLLPAQHPQLEGFDIFGGSYPARKTCGDWFDYLRFQDGSLGLVVGDVSGKGFGPAILSATIAAYLEVFAETHSDVREILTFCNRLVCKRCLEGQFSILALAKLRAGERVLTYGGAGDRMLIVGSNGCLKYTVTASGFPVGLDGDHLYEAPAQIPLEPGDVLLMLTDGFREALTSDGDLFGESRIIATVAANSHATAPEIFKALWEAARKFSNGERQSDDMTGIVVKVLDT